jgi:hypothetical protein
MNYIVTEDEYNALISARSQLELVSGLLSRTNESLPQFEIEGLYEFIGSQAVTLKGVIKAIDKRHEEAHPIPSNISRMRGKLVARSLESTK